MQSEKNIAQTTTQYGLNNTASLIRLATLYQSENMSPELRSTLYIEPFQGSELMTCFHPEKSGWLFKLNPFGIRKNKF